MDPIRQALQHGLKKLSFVLEHKVSRQFDVLYTKGWTEWSSYDFHMVNAAHMNQQYIYIYIYILDANFPSFFFIVLGCLDEQITFIMRLKICVQMNLFLNNQ
ncbi:hypothetical protein MTR67_022476 [Solanum verrucosum]|uniref:Uncharacterized protein n=1 Tax=Solanum verrucosum TaxID=315347 RepID=A0AAF0TQT3_SOLVR|nr:hypothetical protein MTR67_022476 [Solanum verrucosum]